MTKAELLSAIAAKYTYVSGESEITDSFLSSMGLKKFQVSYWDAIGDVIRSGDVYFFTSTDETQAWWDGGEPKPGTTFADEVRALIHSKIDDATIDSAVVTHFDKRAARVSFLQGGVEKIGYITEDQNGDLSYIII